MTIRINTYAGVDEMFVHPRYTVVMRLTVATCALTLEASSVAFAAKPAWRDAPYPYTIINQDVTNIIKNFGYNTGLKVSVAQDVKGTVHGQESSGTAGNFLDEVTKSNDLDWYSDGTVIYVSPAADEETATVSLNETGPGFLTIQASNRSSKHVHFDDHVSAGDQGNFAVPQARQRLCDGSTATWPRS